MPLLADHINFHGFCAEQAAFQVGVKEQVYRDPAVHQGDSGVRCNGVAINERAVNRFDIQLGAVGDDVGIHRHVAGNGVTAAGGFCSAAGAVCGGFAHDLLGVADGVAVRIQDQVLRDLQGGDGGGAVADHDPGGGGLLGDFGGGGDGLQIHAVNILVDVGGGQDAVRAFLKDPGLPVFQKGRVLLLGLIGDGFVGDDGAVGDPLDHNPGLGRDGFRQGGGDQVFFAQGDASGFQGVGYGTFQHGNVPGSAVAGQADIECPADRQAVCAVLLQLHGVGVVFAHLDSGFLEDFSRVVLVGEDGIEKGLSLPDGDEVLGGVNAGHHGESQEKDKGGSGRSGDSCDRFHKLLLCEKYPAGKAA